MTSLNGKWALITGASRGIGRAIALAFAREGANIIACARGAKDLEGVKSEIEALGRSCVAQSVDVSDPSAISQVIAQVQLHTSELHVLVNSAGIYPERGSFADTDPVNWWRTLEVNVRGPVLLTHGLLPLLPRGAKIINLTSGKGFQPGQNSTSYHVSKAALNMLSNGLANELWERDIDVNMIVPGPTATVTFSRDDPAAGVTAEDILKRLDGNLPKGLPAWERVKHPDEVAQLALQLARYPIGGPTGQVFSLARRPL